MKIPSNLIRTDFLEFRGGSADTKKAFHAAGKAFLRAFSKEVGNVESCKVSSCLGGPAVLGEATLHSDRLYLSIFESDPTTGVRILYRTCRGRKDTTGGANRYVSMSDLASSPERLDEFIEECKLIEKSNIAA
jgi:hypothetical protein